MANEILQTEKSIHRGIHIVTLKGLWEILHQNDHHGDSRMGDPLMQNPYVYAAIDRIAKTISHIPTKFMRDPAFKVESYRQDFKTIMYGLGEADTFDQKIKRVTKLRQDLLKNKELCNKHGIKAQTSFSMEEVFNHPLQRLLATPNPIMTKSKLWNATVMMYLNDGQVFWIVERTKEGKPVQIWPHKKKAFEPILDKNGVLTGWKFSANIREGGSVKEKTRDLKLDQVVRFYKFHPGDHFDGLSPNVPAMADLLADFLARKFNNAFFKNGAVGDLFLVTKDTLTAKKKREFREEWKAKNEGAEKGHKTTLLDGGLTPVERQSHKDMEFIRQREWTRDIAFASYGTPKAIIAGQEENVNRASFTSAKTAFFELTVIPELCYLAEEVYNAFLLKKEPDVLMMFDIGKVEGLRGTFVDITTGATNLLKHGWTRNEVNARYGLGYEENKDWGNTAFGNGALVPFSELKNAKPSSQAPAEPESPVTNPDGDTRTLRQKAIDKTKKKFDWFEFAKKVFIPNENKFGREYNKRVDLLRTHQLDLISKIKSQKVSSEELNELVFDLREWTNIFNEVPNAVAFAAVESAFNSLISDLGGVFTFNAATDLNVLDAIDLTATTVRDITRMLQRRVKDQIKKGIKNKENSTQIASRLDLVFNFAKFNGLRIARTEVARLVSTTRYNGFQVEGVEKKLWSTAGDEHVRGDHKIFGSHKPEGSKFNYMQLVGNGGILKYPSDPGGPANQVINCRCVLLPSN
jgi:HK97 family phage portal protein